MTQGGQVHGDAACRQSASHLDLFVSPDRHSPKLSNLDGVREWPIFWSVDTGGTYTDAVILDEAADAVIRQARPDRADLALGRPGGRAALRWAQGSHRPRSPWCPALSARRQNALVEGQGGRVAR
jgi:hypothetical protein